MGHSSFLTYEDQHGVTRQAIVQTYAGHGMSVTLPGFNITSIERYDSERKIKSLTVGRNSIIDIEINKVFDVNGFKFKVQEILIEDLKQGQRIILRSRRLNISSQFITPMYFSPSEFSLIEKFFVGAFIGLDVDFNFNLQHDHVMLVFRINGVNVKGSFYDDIEPILFRKVNYTSLVQLDDYNIGFIMSIPTDCLVDYQLILRGKYSKISLSYKDHIICCYQLTENSILFQVLNHNKSRQLSLEKELDLPPGTLEDIELYEQFDLQNEIYKSEYLITNDKRLTSS